MSALAEGATAFLREFCPDLAPFLRVTLELPDERGRRGNLFIGWPGVTGNHLAAGIALLNTHERRRGLGQREWRLRAALKEMQRRYQALGGNGHELVSAVLKQGAIEGVAEPALFELVDGRGALS